MDIIPGATIPHPFIPADSADDRDESQSPDGDDGILWQNSLRTNRRLITL